MGDNTSRQREQIGGIEDILDEGAPVFVDENGFIHETEEDAQDPDRRGTAPRNPAFNAEDSVGVRITWDGNLVSLIEPHGSLGSDPWKTVGARTPWYEEDPIRFRQESDAMELRFPGFTLQRFAEERIGWLGKLRGQYQILLRYPEDFPCHMIAAYIRQPKFESAHKFRTGELCLEPADGGWTTNTTAAGVAAMVSLWIEAYERHRDVCRQGPGGKPCLKEDCPDWPRKMDVESSQ